MIVLMALNIVLQTKYAARQDTVPEVPAKEDAMKFHQFILQGIRVGVEVEVFFSFEKENQLGPKSKYVL
jgi:hypothetical protein